jgi:lipoprotein-anchoring transpeptidase ErfK/SrfK
MPGASLLSMVFAIGSLFSWSGAGEGRGVAAREPEVAPLRLEVSVGDRQLRVLREGTLVQSYTVAVGQERYPTPRGEFTVRRLVWNPRWVPPKVPWARGKTAKGPGDPDNPMGKVKIFFKDPDYYIHGTRAEESLGQAASHGCVRMANEDVVELAKLVMEHGGQAREPSWFERILSLVRSQEVRLAQPVPVTVVD